MFDTLEIIQRSAFPSIVFLLKTDWDRLGNCPASDLKFSSAEVIYVDDTDNIPYIQKYIVTTSTKSRV